MKHEEFGCSCQSFVLSIEKYCDDDDDGDGDCDVNKSVNEMNSIHNLLIFLLLPEIAPISCFFQPSFSNS